MQEHEERPLGVLLQPGHRVRKSILRPPLYGLEAILALPLAVKPGGVGVEAPLEPRCEPILRIQNNRADKRASDIAARLQQRRQIWQLRPQLVSKIVDLMKLRIGSGKDGRVRHRREWRL